MAIDTENKRRSVQAYWIGGMRPVPDAIIDASDRAASAGYYAGLTYDAPSLIIILAAQFHKLFHLHFNIHRFS